MKRPSRKSVPSAALYKTTRGLAALLIASSSFSALAADRVWDGSDSTAWNDPNNWTPTGVPTNENAFINTNTGNIATVTANTPTANDVNVGDGAGQNGRLNHTAGTLSMNSWMFVGKNSGTGTYNIANTGGTGGIFTGLAQGSGSLTVGGRLYVGGANAGNGGNGTMNINTSGTINIGSDFVIGNEAGGGTGVVNMDNGTFNRNGGVTIIGFRPGGSGTFNMSGGTVTTAGGETQIGILGSTGNNFNLSGGTYNAGGEFWTGNNGGSSATTTVSGGTLNVNSWLAVGRQGATGILNINGTAVVNQGITNTGSFLELTNAGAGGSGTVNLDGGNLNVNGVVQSGGSGSTFNFNGGTLKANISNGTFMQGLTTANVRNGGAKIDTNGNNITVAQPLLHSNIVGDNAKDGGLTKSGIGVLTLTGASTFTGDININGGSVVAGTTFSTANPTATTLGNPQVNRNINVNTGTLQFTVNDVLGNSGSTVVATTVIGVGGVVTNNGGQFNILGPVTLNGGTLTGTGGANGTFQMYGLSGPVTVGGNAMSTISGSGANAGYHLAAGGTTFNVADSVAGAGVDLTVSGQLINTSNTLSAASLIKTGAGTMLLTGANTYTGGTTISNGTIVSGARGLGSGAVSVASGATLAAAQTGGVGLAGQYFNITPTNVNNTNPNFNSLEILQASLATTAPSQVQNATSLNFGNTGGGFPAPYNSGSTNFESYYSGKINITTAGTYTFNTSSDDGSMLFIDGKTVVTNNFFQGVVLRSGTITLSAGYHDIAVGFYQGTGGYGLNAQISGANNTTMVDINTANTAITPDLIIGSLSGAGSVALTTGNLITGQDNTNQTYSGAISGIGSVNKWGTGTQTLTGANTYTGNTIVTSGALNVSSGGSISSTVNLFLSNGGNMDIANGTVTAQNLGIGYNAAGTSTVTVGSAGVLNVGNTGGGMAAGLGNLVFIGGSGNGVGGGGVTAGNGVLTVGTGGAVNVAAGGAFPNDFLFLGGYGGNGVINLNGGTLTTARGISTGTNGNSINFSNGGTLKFTGASPSLQNNIPLTFGAGGGTIDVAAPSFLFYEGTFNGADTLTVLASAGNNQQLLYAGTSNGTFTGNIIVGNATANSGFLQYRSGNANAFGTGSITVNAGGTFSADNGNTNPTTLGNNFVLNGGLLATQVPNMTYTGAVSLTATSSVGHTANGNGTVTLSGVVSGAGGLNVVGGSTVTLTNANSYSGPTAVSGNTILQAGNGGAGGTLGTGSVSVAAGSELRFNRNNTYAANNTLSGTGVIRQSGAGITSLTGDGSQFTGTVNVDAGTLALNNDTTTALGNSGNGVTVNVNSGGILGGTGRIYGQVNVNSGGRVNPGNSPGVMSVVGVGNQPGNFNIMAGGTLEFEIVAPSATIANANTLTIAAILSAAAAPATGNDDQTAGTGYGANLDHLNVAGTLTVSGTGTISIIDLGYGSGTIRIGDIFNLLDAGTYAFASDFDSGPEYRFGGTTENNLYDLDLPALPGFGQFGLAFNTSLFESDGILVVVPEPSRALLLLAGAGMLAMRRRRRS